MSRICHPSVPVPLLVDLLEVNAILEDPAPTDEEEHVAEGVPELVHEPPECKQYHKMEAPSPFLAFLLPWPRADHLGYNWTIKKILH